MLRAAVSFLVVLTVSGTDFSTHQVHPNSFTSVNLTVGDLSEGSVLGVEVKLNSNTRVNTTVFFTTVYHGEIHSWSLDTAKETIVTKYLCGLNSQNQDRVRE